MFARIRLFTLLLLFGTLSSLGHATTVTFTGFSPQGTCLPSVSTGGLTFTNNAERCLGVFAGSPNAGTALVFGFNTKGHAVITQTNGAAFTLDSLNMTISWYDTLPSDTLTVTADFEGGGVSSQTLTLFQGLQTFNLNLSNVSQVDFSGLANGTGYWAISSLTYTPVVPEPASLLFLATGLLGLAVAARQLLRR